MGTDLGTPGGPADQYATGTHLCWYLSRPSDELAEAVDSGWLGRPGTVLDLGCGLGSELSYLARLGWIGLGVDLSSTALRKASSTVAGTHFVGADVRRLPVPDNWATALLDRGCFHYLQPEDRAGYVSEAERVLRPGGRFPLRACLPHRPSQAGVSEPLLRHLFRRWKILSVVERTIPVNEGTLSALEGRFERSVRAVDPIP